MIDENTNKHIQEKHFIIYGKLKRGLQSNGLVKF
jgi:hypothetical protein